MRVLTLGSAEVFRLKVKREKDKLVIRETESRSGKYETWSALPVLKRDGYKVIILDVKNLDPISRLISVSYKAKEYLVIREDAVLVNSPAMTLRYSQYIPKLLQAGEMAVPMEEEGERELDDLDSSLLDLCSVNSRNLYKRLRFEVEPDEISYLSGPVGAGKRELVALVLTGYLLVDDYRTIFITASKPSAVGDLFYFIQKGLEVRLVEGEGFYLSADENDNVVKLSILAESSKCRMVKTVQFVYPEEVGQLITPEILVWQGFNDLPDDLIVSTLTLAKQRTIVVNSDMGGYVSVGQVKSLGILDRLSTAKKIREYKLEGNLCKIWSELFLLQAPMILPLDLSGLPVGHECVVYRIVKRLVLVNPEHQEFVGNLVSILAGSMDSFDIDVVLKDWLLGSEYEIFVMMPKGDRRILGACVLKIGTSAYFDKMAREYNIQDEVWSESLVSLVWIAVHPAVRQRGYGAQMVSKLLRKMNTKISLEDFDKKLLLENSVTDNETDFSLMAIEFVLTDMQTSFWNSFAPECEFLWSSLPESKGVITVGMFRLKGSLDWVNHIRFRDQWVQRLSGPYNKINVRLATNVVLYQTTKGIDSIDDESISLFFDEFDFQRFERHLSLPMEQTLIGDLWPLLGLLYFRGHCKAIRATADLLGVPDPELSPFHQATLLGVGLQRKTREQIVLHEQISLCSVKQIAKELDLPVDQVTIQFRLCHRRLQRYLHGVRTCRIGKHVQTQLHKELYTDQKSSTVLWKICNP